MAKDSKHRTLRATAESKQIQRGDPKLDLNVDGTGTKIEDIVDKDIVVASGLSRLRDGQRCTVEFDDPAGPYVIADSVSAGEDDDFIPTNKLYLGDVVSKTDGTLVGLELSMKSDVRRKMEQ